MNKKIICVSTACVLSCCLFVGCSCNKVENENAKIEQMTEEELQDAINAPENQVPFYKYMEEAEIKYEDLTSIVAKDLNTDPSQIQLLFRQIDYMQEYNNKLVWIYTFSFNKDGYKFIIDANTGEILYREKNTKPM